MTSSLNARTIACQRKRNQRSKAPRTAARCPAALRPGSSVPLFERDLRPASFTPSCCAASTAAPWSSYWESRPRSSPPPPAGIRRPPPSGTCVEEVDVIDTLPHYDELLAAIRLEIPADEIPRPREAWTA